MLTTKLNRPNQESEHAGEERDYSTNGGRHTGNSRIAAAGGAPYNSPWYASKEEVDDLGEDAHAERFEEAQIRIDEEG